ncbi:hypothetical protein Taro_041816 [Colocasia esculenta]|uniref:Uncharacterized protein n=1 Tax=Colocasia esculenta TaxID=4460 RepID=A0A843WQZ9_COLES|nr:hypothetical protein [Colocasia esculenta]
MPVIKLSFVFSEIMNLELGCSLFYELIFAFSLVTIGLSTVEATPGGDKGAAVGVRMGASTLVALVFFWWFLVA